MNCSYNDVPQFNYKHFPFDVPVSARYSIHLRGSITWSRNGQMKKKEETSEERGDCNFPIIINRILNFGPIVCVLESCGTSIHG